jgi:hypothetical protein
VFLSGDGRGRPRRSLVLAPPSRRGSRDAVAVKKTLPRVTYLEYCEWFRLASSNVKACACVARSRSVPRTYRFFSRDEGLTAGCLVADKHNYTTYISIHLFQHGTYRRKLAHGVDCSVSKRDADGVWLARGAARRKGLPHSSLLWGRWCA